MVANATGCSSIYGGSLPTTPWTTDADGRGPAWSNSLFEDNAEFGLGLRLASDGHVQLARRRLAELRDAVGAELVDAILERPAAAGVRVGGAAGAGGRAAGSDSLSLDPTATADLLSVVDHLVRRSVWIVGGDGWAYDIGSGGLDHVLATGRNVNVLVLDTEVYSNTGGQMSKSTPLGAVAKFAAAGKTVPKKDLALQAIAYGNVYVAKVAMGADPQQTLQAFREAEAYDGPSLVIAYSQCIAHGIDMRLGMDQQYRAVASGHWPLLRYDPVLRAAGNNPFLLDSHRPRIPLADYVYRELRYRVTGQLRSRRRPNGCSAWPNRRSSSAGMSTRRWLPAVPNTSTPTPAGSVDGPVHPLPRPRRCATRWSRRRPRCRRPSTGCGVSPTPESVRWCSIRCSKSNCAAKPRRMRALPSQAPRASPSRCRTSLAAAADDHGPRRYLSLLERAAAAVSVPVIGSINGSTPGGWAGYARSMQDSGAAAIELNVYYLPGDPHVSGRDVEQRHLDILAGVKDAVSVPVAVKLSPYFSATAEMARRLDLAGANGLVLFNRFLQPDIDPETLTVAPGTSLSRAGEARLPMTWIALLHGRIDASLAATTGVEGAKELIKYLLAGADVVMTASALLRHGPDHAAVMLDGLRRWMRTQGIHRGRRLSWTPCRAPSTPTKPHANAGTTSPRCGEPTAPTSGRGDRS